MRPCYPLTCAQASTEARIKLANGMVADVRAGSLLVASTLCTSAKADKAMVKELLQPIASTIKDKIETER